MVKVQKKCPRSWERSKERPRELRGQQGKGEVDSFLAGHEVFQQSRSCSEQVQTSTGGWREAEGRKEIGCSPIPTNSTREEGMGGAGMSLSISPA